MSIPYMNCLEIDVDGADGFTAIDNVDPKWNRKERKDAFVQVKISLYNFILFETRTLSIYLFICRAV